MEDEKIYQVNEVLEYLTKRKEFAEYNKLNSVCIDTNYIRSIMQIIHSFDQKNNWQYVELKKLREENEKLKSNTNICLKDVKEMIIRW